MIIIFVLISVEDDQAPGDVSVRVCVHRGREAANEEVMIECLITLHYNEDIKVARAHVDDVFVCRSPPIA